MNKTEPRTLSGFMELYPREQLVFDNIKNTIIDIYKSYGFYPLDTPIIEYSEVLLAKAGGDTEKQLYRFKKGDNDLTLRFDLTVPLAKYVASRYNELVFPFKRFQSGKVFRGERPQNGRFREFYQMDIDVIGDEELSIKYDSELLSIINDVFTKLNFGKFKIKINNRKILGGFFDSLGLSDKITDVLRVVDKLEKIGEVEVKNDLTCLDIEPKTVEKIIEFINIKGSNDEILNKLKSEYSLNETLETGINELETVINDLKLRGVNESNYVIDLTIARGFDYYTGTVYETTLVDFPNIGSISSGGRYDNLAEYYTDKKLPGVGASIGVTRLFSVLKEIGVIKVDDTSSSDIMILPMCDNYDYIYEVNNTLKDLGLSVNICYLDKGFKSKMKYANKMNNKYVIIIGEDEVKKNIVTLKNMIDGSQTEIDKEDLINIKKMMGD